MMKQKTRNTNLLASFFLITMLWTGFFSFLGLISGFADVTDCCCKGMVDVSTENDLFSSQVFPFKRIELIDN